MDKEYKVDYGIGKLRMSGIRRSEDLKCQTEKFYLLLCPIKTHSSMKNSSKIAAVQYETEQKRN